MQCEVEFWSGRTGRREEEESCHEKESIVLGFVHMSSRKDVEARSLAQPHTMRNELERGVYFQRCVSSTGMNRGLGW